MFIGFFNENMLSRLWNNKWKNSLIGTPCVIVAMKICEEVNKEKYIDDFFIERLKFLSKENIYSIMDLSSKILIRAQNYDKFYPNVKHL